MAHEAKAAGASGGNLSLPNERGDVQEESTVSLPSLHLPSHTPLTLPTWGCGLVKTGMLGLWQHMRAVPRAEQSSCRHERCTKRVTEKQPRALTLTLRWNKPCKHLPWSSFQVNFHWSGSLSNTCG